MASKQEKLIKSASIVIIVTVCAKIFGFFREMAMGFAFGTGPETGLYNWATSVTTVIYLAFASAIAFAMLPALNEYRLEGKDEHLKKYINKIITFGIAICCVIMPILIVSAPAYVRLMARNLEGHELILTITLVQLLVPSLIFITITYMTKTILQAYEKFFIYSIVSLPYNLILLLYLIFFAEKFGIYGLAIATVIGWISQIVIQLPMLYKLKVRYTPDVNLKDKDVGKFITLMMPLLVSTLVYSVNTMVDKTLALSLSPAKVAGLNYGYMIYSSIVTTIILGISTVLFPKFIEAKVLKTKDEQRRELGSILSVMIYIAAPLMIAFIVLSKPFVEVAYMRGKFDAMSVELTYVSLIFYSLGTLSYAISEILQKMFFALGDSKTPMKVSLIAVGANIALNLSLAPILDYKGLALATSLSIFISSCIMYVLLEKKMGKLNLKKQLILLGKVSLSLVGSVLICNAIIDRVYVTGGNLIFNIGALILSASGAGIIYIIATYILNVEETKFILKNYLKIGGINEKR